MKTSESITELATALAKAQGEMGPLIKDANNPHFRSQYATLAGVTAAVVGPFSKHGISFIQSGELKPGPSGEDDLFGVTTMLMHSSGQWLETFTPVYPAKYDPQGIGSAITYGRRYSLMAVAGLAPEDDDGEAAMGRPPKQQAAQPAKSQPKATPVQKQGKSASGDQIAVITKLFDELKFDEKLQGDSVAWATKKATRSVHEMDESEAAHLIESLLEKQKQQTENTNG